jgi:uncharacterized protein YbjT (DUF2867 family)
MSVDVLVYCANGLVGQASVRELRRAGLTVRALVRDVRKASGLEDLGAHVVAASLDDPVALRKAHQDVSTVLFQLPVGREPQLNLQVASTAISAMRKAGVRQIVYNAAVQVPRQSDELPTFSVTRDIEKELQNAGMALAVIRPTFLLQNLLLPWVTHSIASQRVLVYPVDPHVALSWVAAEDIGRMTAAIIRHSAYNRSIHLASRKAIDGVTLAHTFSRTLGRSIDYVGLPLNEFEAHVDAAVGAGAGEKVGAIFRFIRHHPNDRAFVTQAFTPPEFLPEFNPTPIAEWIRLHKSSFATA